MLIPHLQIAHQGGNLEVGNIKIHLNVSHISELQCKVWGVLVHHILESCQEECGKKWLCCISMFISCQRSAKYAGNVWNKN